MPLTRLRRGEAAQSIVEAAILVGLIAIVTVAALSMIGGVSGYFTTIASALTSSGSVGASGS